VSLRARIEHLEAERARGAIEILRMHPDGGAVVTALRDGRVVSRREVTAEEAARLAKRAITIERTYGLPTSEARDDLPPTEKI
jgi:hypothetical protein